MNALILDFLKTNGERSEAEIAKGLHVPMTVIQSHLSQLASAGAVICCKVTRFRGGKKIEGTSCRLSLEDRKPDGAGDVPTERALNRQAPALTDGRLSPPHGPRVRRWLEGRGGGGLFPQVDQCRRRC